MKKGHAVRLASIGRALFITIRKIAAIFFSFRFKIKRIDSSAIVNKIVSALIIDGRFVDSFKTKTPNVNADDGQNVKSI